MKLKSIFTNSFGILISRITGFLRDALMASALGTSIYMDIFVVAWKLPNLFRNIFAEGAFTQAFMPSFVASRNKAVFATAIFLRFILFLFFISLSITLFPESITKLLAIGWSAETITKSAPLVSLYFWYLNLVFVVTFLATLLQYKEHFLTSALSTSLLNISMIAALLIFMQDSPKLVAYAIGFSVLLGGVLQILVHFYTLHKLKLHRLLLAGWTYRHKKDVRLEKKNFTALFIPALWGNSSTQINSFVGTMLASFLVTGSIAHLYFAQRLFQLPLALFAIATATALFPSISKAIKNQKEKEAFASLEKAFWLLTFALGFAMIAGMFLAEPIIWLLFEHGKFSATDTKDISYVLIAYMLGLLPLGLAKLFSLFLYASKRQGKAAKIATISVIVNILASLVLMQSYAAVGLALAGSIGGWVLFILTMKEVGWVHFWKLLYSKKSLYFLSSLVLFAFVLDGLNVFLLAYIRG